MKCKNCETETEFYCDSCGDPLCEDCGDVYDQYTQSDAMKKVWARPGYREKRRKMRREWKQEQFRKSVEALKTIAKMFKR